MHGPTEGIISEQIKQKKFFFTLHKVKTYSQLCSFWTPSSSQKGPIKQGLSILPSARFSGKICLPQNLGKWTKNWLKTGCFEFIERFGDKFLQNLFYNETYIICCVPAKIPYLGSFLFLRCGPACSQPIRLQDFLINQISRTN